MTAFLGPIAVEEVLYDTVHSLGSAASSVTIAISEPLPLVLGDRGLLERAIANVIANAVAWSPPELAVVVESAVIDGQVRLQVTDQGPGIPTEQRERVFLPFHRLAGPTDSRPDGIGLGLAVARGFTEAVGGALTIEDAPGCGTTFVFTLQAVEP